MLEQPNVAHPPVNRLIGLKPASAETGRDWGGPTMTTQLTAISLTRLRQSVHQPSMLLVGKHITDPGPQCHSVRPSRAIAPLRSSRAVIRKAVEADTVLSEAIAESELQVGSYLSVYGSVYALDVLSAHVMFECPSSRRSAFQHGQSDNAFSAVDEEPEFEDTDDGSGLSTHQVPLHYL